MTDLEYENNRQLDVVNADDEVIDSKSRIDVHRLGLLHREVHVWMFDENHNIFFQKRGLDRPSAGLLDATIGGHVNNDEDYFDAAVREAKEEVGISISTKNFIFLKKFKNFQNISENNFFGTINNFIRTVYIYKHPISDKIIKREVGIPGVGFQKLSLSFFSDKEKEYSKMFDKFILTDELPLVLEYLK